MGWPRVKNREAVAAEIKTGLKTARAIAEECGCSQFYVYKVTSEEGFFKQFITQEEWRYILDWRANRAQNRATSPDAAKPLVGPVNGSTGKARRASDNARLAQTIG